MPSLEQITEKIKWSHQVWWLLLLIILSSTLAFGLGRRSGLQASKVPISIQYPNLNKETNIEDVNGDAAKQGSEGQNASAGVALRAKQYVGSRSGKKYHLPWCGGAKRIKEENKIWFNSKAEAKAAGYEPAANCPGL